MKIEIESLMKKLDHLDAMYQRYAQSEEDESQRTWYKGKAAAFADFRFWLLRVQRGELVIEEEEVKFEPEKYII